ncbi:MAG: SDR family oxidoreductase [Chloroflexi bacterium]|nr:SDR family oxidoreductase [Chloroflexota bacterium]
MPQDFSGQVALVTGASRGIGAEISRQLAQRGADIVINYRSKASRAEAVASEITALGRTALLAQADLTQINDLITTQTQIQQAFGKLDLLVLNASGGLEKDKPASYAMDLNLTAQVQTVETMLPLMQAGSCIVFVTSHWAHFYGERPIIAGYEPVASSKKAGEMALRERIDQFIQRGIHFYVVSGDMIEGTITPKLLDRAQPGFLAARKEHSPEPIPTIEEFASAIVATAADRSQANGHTVFVGPII